MDRVRISSFRKSRGHSHPTSPLVTEFVILRQLAEPGEPPRSPLSPTGLLGPRRLYLASVNA
eukprot:2673613-Pyramimonas_sp.AAC.1